MPKQDTHILIAEDLEANRFALDRMLKKSIYKDKFTFATTGEEALKLLKEQPKKYNVALLDRMMPGMSGMDLLKAMKADALLKYIPVIFQTAMVRDDAIAEGLAAGAHYYITKPYPDKEVFLSIIHSAVAQYQQIADVHAKSEQVSLAFALVDSFDLHLQSIEEVAAVASYIASAFPDPSRVSTGILELLLNAVEHGNVGITYDEKTKLNNEGIWREEVRRRLALPENANKRVSVHFERSNDYILISIKDEGKGFHWQDYLELDPKRAFDNHGRGIAVANLMCFDQITYQGTGNEVHAIINL